MFDALRSIRTVVRRLVALSPVLFAVVTVPVALLALFNAGVVTAIEILVTGLLLLVPLSAILAWVVLDLSPVDLPGGLCERSVDLPGVTVGAGSASGADSLDAAGPAADEDRSVALLRERFARGEIDQAEFEQRLDRLVETEDATVDRRPDAGSVQRDQTADEVGAGRQSGGRRSPAPRDREPEST